MEKEKALLEEAFMEEELFGTPTYIPSASASPVLPATKTGTKPKHGKQY
jgi:hypothetical protein